MPTKYETARQLTAGGIAGTAGAIVTCPLEVVKTRLQSSNARFEPNSSSSSSRLRAKGSQLQSPSSLSSLSSSHSRTTDPSRHFSLHRSDQFSKQNNSYCSSNSSNIRSSTTSSSSSSVERTPVSSVRQPSVLQCLRFIVQTEGVGGLFRGLGANLVGVAPSRAIYFWAYDTAKRELNSNLAKRNRDTPFVHIVAAFSAGLCTSTATNPIWLVKTRLQLDRASGNRALSVRECIRRIRVELGLRGFWKGVTASYWGISETVIHFVIYEFLKEQVALLKERRREDNKGNSRGEKTAFDFVGYMLCGACSKSCATIIAYPHEVARTRLREEGTKYYSFWQTLATVFREEGRRGLYRGLVTQLLRQIPNTAITMSVYELIVYLMDRIHYGRDRRA